MYSNELLYRITRNNNCFRKSNLKTVFNSDPSSGNNSFGITRCTYLNRNRVTISCCPKDCQVTITKV